MLLAILPGSALAGRLVATGHDIDYHCWVQNAQCEFIRSTVNYVRAGAPDPTKPVLVLERSSNLWTHSLQRTFGTTFGVQEVSMDPRSAQFADAPLTTDLYSAILVGSDATCGGCDLNDYSTTTDSNAINARTAEIAAFFNAGGGLLFASGAQHGNSATGPYYQSVPIPVGGTATSSPYTVQPPGTAIGLTDADANCCATHNSFTNPDVGSSIKIAETDGTGNAETLISEGSIVSGHIYTLGLSPATSTGDTGTSHTVTAHLADQSGAVSGKTVRFSVSGANTATGTGTTDANGDAAFTYTGATAGDDAISACGDLNTDDTCGTSEPSGTAARTWTTPAVTHTLSVGDDSVTEGATGQIPVTLDSASTHDVSLHWSTGTSGSADTGDFTAASGTVTIPAGSISADLPVVTTDDGIVEGDETVAVSISAPSGATIADGDGTLTIADNDTATVTVGHDTVTEGATGHVVLTLGAAAERDVRVGYATADDGATAGSDYTATSGTATIAKGDTTTTVDIPTTDDTVVEGDEHVAVSATADPPLVRTAARLAVVAPTTGLTITDNDTPELSVADASTPESADGALTVTLGAPAERPVDVSYTTGGGTATAGDDYTAANPGSVTIAKGDTSAVITVPVVDDTIGEGNETVGVHLAAGDDATLTIVDNDATLSIGDVTVSPPVISADRPVYGKLPVTLATPAVHAITVKYATGTGTASAGSFVPASGTLTFAAGETAKTVDVRVLETETPDRTIPVTLSDATTAVTDDVGVLTVRKPPAGTGGTSAQLPAATTVPADPAPAASSTPAGDVAGFTSSGGTTVSIANGRVRERNRRTRRVTLTITASQVSDTPRTVTFGTVPGTAKAGQDFVAQLGKAVIPAGALSTTITIRIVNDHRHEHHAEQFYVVLDNGYAATVTIVDNDHRRRHHSTRR